MNRPFGSVGRVLLPRLSWNRFPVSRITPPGDVFKPISRYSCINLPVSRKRELLHTRTFSSQSTRNSNNHKRFPRPSSENIALIMGALVGSAIIVGRGDIWLGFCLGGCVYLICGASWVVGLFMSAFLLHRFLVKKK